ncbi:MAG: OsmC family peroxiredoxin [Myxococcota bacterium]
MTSRKAEARWNGSLREGAGRLTVQSGAVDVAYDFRSRFETGQATNPEELLGAAHAGCFTMAIAAALAREGLAPTWIHTTASVHLNQGAAGFEIPKIELRTRAQIAGVDAAKFLEIAESAKKNCPLSKALASVEITLDAALEA